MLNGWSSGPKCPCRIEYVEVIFCLAEWENRQWCFMNVSEIENLIVSELRYVHKWNYRIMMLWNILYSLEFYLVMWGQSKVLRTNSKSGSLGANLRMKCSTPWHLAGKGHFGDRYRTPLISWYVTTESLPSFWRAVSNESKLQQKLFLL